LTLPRIFIGSSRESLRLARGIRANLEEVGEVRIWDEDLFVPGRFALEELVAFTRSFDFAVFVWSGDDTTSSRGLTIASPRDNVMLEAGLFYGSLGRERVFLVAPRNETVKTPSDLLGVTIATYLEPSDKNYRAATGSACNGLVNQIERLGPLVGAAPSESPGLDVNTYPDFAAAREDMTAACKKAREVKILSNKGLVFFGLDESVMSPAEVAEYTLLRRLRVLLIDPESSWINRGLAALRRYESIDNYKRELSAAHLIVDSSMARFRTQLDLSRSGGVRHHVGAPCFRLLMTEETAFVSSYAEEPSTQVRDLPVFAYANRHGSLYQAYKRHFNELWHNEAHAPRSPETARSVEVSAGGIVLTTDNQATYVTLLQRDDGSWVLPKGHRDDGGGGPQGHCGP
jgi:hypothetical protein